MASESGEVASQGGGIPYDSIRQADLYWRQIVQLKGAAVCIRLYRNRLAGGVKVVEFVKAAASSGAIAGWAVTESYKLIWGCVIAAAQLLDVFKDVFPFAKMHKQAVSLTIALEFLLINAEDEWEKIHIGKMSDEMIIERRTRLKLRQLDARAEELSRWL